MKRMCAHRDFMDRARAQATSDCSLQQHQTARKRAQGEHAKGKREENHHKLDNRVAM
jgi:hypothetical protein